MIKMEASGINWQMEKKKQQAGKGKQYIMLTGCLGGEELTVLWLELSVDSLLGSSSISEASFVSFRELVRSWKGILNTVYKRVFMSFVWLASFKYTPWPSDKP